MMAKAEATGPSGATSHHSLQRTVTAAIAANWHESLWCVSLAAEACPLNGMKRPDRSAMLIDGHLPTYVYVTTISAGRGARCTAYAVLQSFNLNRSWIV
jgi:hypothetical protein